MAIEKVAEKVVEEVATNLEDVAEVTRSINTAAVSAFMGGTGFGLLLGFFYGMRFNREKIRKEAFEESKKEVEDIKAQFKAAQDVVNEARKDVRASLQGEKPALEAIVEEKGYDVPRTDYTRPLPPPVPIVEITSNVPVEVLSTDSAKVIVSPTDGDIITYPENDEPNEPIRQWNQALEQSRRNTLVPYVIHRNEYGAEGSESNGYETKNLLYYSHDGVLLDIDTNEVVNTDRIVGANNLKWGHGSEDPDTVFVRNDKLRIEMEIRRIDESYEGEVLGLDVNEPSA